MKQSRVLPRAAGWLLAAATVLLAALLILQCAGIYHAGTAADNLTEAGVRIHDIYSREIVGERFARIAWAAWLWLALLVIAWIARVAGQETQPVAPTLSAESRWELLRTRVTLTPAMEAEERLRRRATLLCALICAGCAMVAGVYALDLRHFSSRELEGVMGALLQHVALWILLAFAALMALAQVCDRSLRRELAAAKDAPKRTPEPQPPLRSHWRLAGRIALYVAAIGLIVAGILNGGMYDVLVKAINICTECIGLG